MTNSAPWTEAASGDNKKATACRRKINGSCRHLERCDGVGLQREVECEHGGAAGEVAADFSAQGAALAALVDTARGNGGSILLGGLAGPGGDFFASLVHPALVMHGGVRQENGGDALRILRVGGVDIACNGLWQLDHAGLLESW